MFVAGTKNSYGFETLEFEFSPEWDGLEKTVTFYPADEEASPVALLIEGEVVPIPQEVMAHAGRASFTVSGYGNGRALVSVNGYLDVIDANDPASDLAKAPTKDYLSSLLETAQNAVDIAQSVRDDADNGVFSSSGGGAPAGGTKGQFLAKKSNADHDTEWVSPVTLYRDEIADLWEEYEDEDSTFPYFCDVSLRGVKSTSCVDVYFYAEDAISGTLSPVCDVFDGFIRLHATNDIGYMEIALIKVVNI